MKKLILLAMAAAFLPGCATYSAGRLAEDTEYAGVLSGPVAVVHIGAKIVSMFSGPSSDEHRVTRRSYHKRPGPEVVTAN